MYGNIINEAFGKVTAKSLNVFITQIKCNAYAVLQISMKRLSLIFGCKKGCKSRNYLIYTLYCGERGIRTPGGLTLNGFQDRRNRPLCHLSENPSGFSRTIFCISSAERTRFELVVENNPYDSLANCWFQPLTHLSSGSLLRVQRYIRYFSLPNFLGCFLQLFFTIYASRCLSAVVAERCGCGVLQCGKF